MKAFVEDADFTLHVGDVLDVLATLPSGSVDCVVTSPPYWGLRDYGVAGQIGLEPTPDLYVARIVAVFRQVRRVLADHGTAWVNLGDSYNNRAKVRETSHQPALNGFTDDRWADRAARGGVRMTVGDVKEKDLVGIPWRVAFALQADGWYLRADIIWAKPNPMPESVTDRPTKAHEYLFLLTKKPRYWFDQEAVREPAEYGRRVQSAPFRSGAENGDGHRSGGGSVTGADPSAGRNVRSVWEIPTQPYPEAHFATFPEELARRCILAGCPERVCRTCGKPRERIVEREPNPTKATDGPNMVPIGPNGERDPRYRQHSGTIASSPGTFLGWSDCGHDNYRPGVVLDPFLGSGTTALVARNHGRRCVGVELSPEYAELAARRLQQLSLLAEVTG